MNNLRVLIVEDDASSADLLKQLLEMDGYIISGCAQTGAEAVREAQRLEPDVVLMDVRIRGKMDGVEAANAIRQFSDIPIIYLTGADDAATVERAKRTTPGGYLLKPFNARELSITMQVAVHKNRMEQKLRENELRLSTVLASVPVAVLQINAAGAVEYMNPVAELFSRRSLERAVGEPVWQLLDLREPETGARLENPVDVFLGRTRTPAQRRPLLLGSSAEGRLIVEVSSTGIRDAAGAVRGHVVALREITQQYAAEEARRSLAAAVEGLPDAVLLATPDSSAGGGARITYCNPSVGAMTGWAVGELINQPIERLQHAEAGAFWQDVRSALEAGNNHQGECLVPNSAGGHFWARFTVSLVQGALGGVIQYVLTFRDISIQRQLEEGVLQSQKIEAVGRLAGGIAHDFNNLLSVINSYADLQIMKLDENAPVMKYARQIRAAGKKGTELIAHLMTFSRRDRPNPALLDLGQVVNEVKGMLARVIREDIELVTACEEGIKPTKADQGQIEQVLINLCLNARDAMPDGGKIEIHVENIRVSKPFTLGRDEVRKGAYVLLRVSDTGCGMAEEVQKRIFDPFFTTKDIGKGTGLGLSTVFTIMKQCGGYIGVESAPGKGARFKLLFPIASGPAGSREVEETPSEAPEGSERVLVVEDDETFLDCICSLLSLHGYEVFTAADGAQAVEQMERLKYQVDLLVSDLVLPRMSGREVAARLLDKNPDTKVVFMTGYDDQLDTFYSLPGDASILEKPFPLNTLLVRVRELLDSSTTVS